ncbi:hypothetical protein QO001_005697 [Methylobacterium brachiatum]|uniref:Uncharacterized protein n=1 Tax=Methylobacterium brachiatum TaxID=269660 RepID=A0AAJ1WZA3_9HYPH|nr:hypothetical protein [Methylobacterium brachiatum]
MPPCGISAPCSPHMRATSSTRAAPPPPDDHRRRPYPTWNELLSEVRAARAKSGIEDCTPCVLCIQRTGARRLCSDDCSSRDRHRSCARRSAVEPWPLRKNGSSGQRRTAVTLSEIDKSQNASAQAAAGEKGRARENCRRWPVPPLPGSHLDRCPARPNLDLPSALAASAVSAWFERLPGLYPTPTGVRAAAGRHSFAANLAFPRNISAIAGKNPLYHSVVQSSCNKPHRPTGRFIRGDPSCSTTL